MKKILVLFLVFFTSIVLAENTIIALVNNTPITLNSIQNKFSNSASSKETIVKLNERIDIILQLQKVNEFYLNPNEHGFLKKIGPALYNKLEKINNVEALDN